MDRNDMGCRSKQALQPGPESAIIQNWGDRHEPLVSICCATYNHSDYIEDALRGILAQKTAFPFEVIIRDDASTDGTADIARNYAQQYPNIIRLVVNPENQFQKGVRPLHAWPSLTRGRYVALCEGDDFWISPTKLQKQVDLLEKHPEAVMSVARTELCQQGEDGLSHISTTSNPNMELLGFDEVHNIYFHTSSYVVRSDIFDKVISDYWIGHTLFGDTALRAVLISIGPFVFLPEVVSVYRMTGSGIWTSQSKERQLRWEYDASRKLAGILPGKHGRFQRERMRSLLKSLLRLHKKDKDYLKTARIYPVVFWHRLTNVPRSLQRKMRRKTGR